MSKPDMQYFAEDGTWVKPPGAKRVTVVLKGGNSTLGRGAPRRVVAYLAAQDAPRTRAEIAAEAGVSEPEADRYLGALLRADRLEVTSPHGTLHYRLLPAHPGGGGGNGGGGAWFGWGGGAEHLAAAPAHGASDGEVAARDLRAGALPPLVEVRVGEGGYALIVTHLTEGGQQ